MSSTTKLCQVCGKEFTKKVNCSLKSWKNRKFCSPSCYADSKKGKSPWNKGQKGLRKYQNMTGLKVGWNMKKGFKKGQVPWNKGRVYSVPKAKAEKHWNWKGGKVGERDRIKTTPEYKIWRRQVFERDNYTCQECGIRGGRLHAHHIKPFAVFPELRTELDNGLTLCVPCHKLTDSYGSKKGLGVSFKTPSTMLLSLLSEGENQENESNYSQQLFDKSRKTIL